MRVRVPSFNTSVEFPDATPKEKVKEVLDQHFSTKWPEEAPEGGMPRGKYDPKRGLGTGYETGRQEHEPTFQEALSKSAREIQDLMNAIPDTKMLGETGKGAMALAPLITKEEFFGRLKAMQKAWGLEMPGPSAMRSLERIPESLLDKVNAVDELTVGFVRSQVPAQTQAYAKKYWNAFIHGTWEQGYETFAKKGHIDSMTHEIGGHIAGYTMMHEHPVDWLAVSAENIRIPSSQRKALEKLTGVSLHNERELFAEAYGQYLDENFYVFEEFPKKIQELVVKQYKRDLAAPVRTEPQGQAAKDVLKKIVDPMTPAQFKNAVTKLYKNFTQELTDEMLAAGYDKPQALRYAMSVQELPIHIARDVGKVPGSLLDRINIIETMKKGEGRLQELGKHLKKSDQDVTEVAAFWLRGYIDEALKGGSEIYTRTIGAIWHEIGHEAWVSLHSKHKTAITKEFLKMTGKDLDDLARKTGNTNLKQSETEMFAQAWQAYVKGLGYFHNFPKSVQTAVVESYAEEIKRTVAMGIPHNAPMPKLPGPK